MEFNIGDKVQLRSHPRPLSEMDRDLVTTADVGVVKKKDGSLLIVSYSNGQSYRLFQGSVKEAD